LSELIAPSWWPQWSADGRSVYYQSQTEGGRRIHRIAIADRAVSLVREELDAAHPSPAADGTLYFTMALRSDIFGWRSADVEIRRARPENGPAEPLVRIPANRLPYSPLFATMQPSPDGQRLATLLTDGATTNIWTISTADGAMAPLTDFGDRLLLMTRSVSWSADGRHVYAAVVEYETDIVLMDGLI
jgi:Tol biopolymer transport system component